MEFEPTDFELCQRLIRDAVVYPSALIPEIIAKKRPIMIWWLTSFICEKRKEVRETIPQTPTIPQEHLDRIQGLLRPKVRSTADILISLASDGENLEELEDRVVAPLLAYKTGQVDMTWAMCLILLEAASQLGELAVYWIRYGTEYAAYLRDSDRDSKKYSLYVSLVYLIRARSGDSEAEQYMRKTFTGLSIKEIERVIRPKAYACFAMIK